MDPLPWHVVEGTLPKMSSASPSIKNQGHRHPRTKYRYLLQKPTSMLRTQYKTALVSLFLLRVALLGLGLKKSLVTWHRVWLDLANALVRLTCSSIESTARASFARLLDPRQKILPALGACAAFGHPRLHAADTVGAVRRSLVVLLRIWAPLEREAGGRRCAAPPNRRHPSDGLRDAK